MATDVLQKKFKSLSGSLRNSFSNFGAPALAIRDARQKTMRAMCNI